MANKAERIGLRVDKPFKEMVRRQAKRESRSVSNLAIMVLQEYCETQEGFRRVQQARKAEANGHDSVPVAK